MNLIVDIGNSFIKVAVFQGDELLQKMIVKPDKLDEEIEKIFSSFPGIEGKILSSVSKRDLLLPERFNRDRNLLILDASTPLPFTNKYGTPQTLGNDRKALIAAASKYYKDRNVLVIDAGTCLTFDFKNHLNEYLGGAISPGLQMRFKALHSFTANLPLLQPGDQPSFIGDSTKTSMNSGVVYGIAKEIDGTIEEYAAEFQDLKIIFTGGDAHFLSKRLKNGIFANSNFLLEGLNYILEFNKTQ